MTDINSYKLSKETINEMVKLIGKTVREKKEYSFRLCEKDKIINPGTICKGRKCAVDISKTSCKNNETPVGIFHTHGKSSEPSVSDLKIGYLEGMNCIGSYQEIKCYKRKDFNFDAFIDMYKVHQRELFLKIAEKERFISEKEFKDEVRKYKESIDKIVDKYFNVIKVRRNGTYKFRK